MMLDGNGNHIIDVAEHLQASLIALEAGIPVEFIREQQNVALGWPKRMECKEHWRPIAIDNMPRKDGFTFLAWSDVIASRITPMYWSDREFAYVANETGLPLEFQYWMPLPPDPGAA